jgi:hypothetical protein
LFRLDFPAFDFYCRVTDRRARHNPHNPHTHIDHDAAARLHRQQHYSMFLVALCVSITVLARSAIARNPQDDVPTAYIDGERVSIRDVFPSSDWQDTRYYILNQEKHLWYMENFVNASIAKELRQFCQHQNRFQRSPIREADDQIYAEDKRRTSESCVLVPAGKYLENPKFDEIRSNPQHAWVVREVDVAWEVSKRAAAWLELSSPHQVESLQVVRYTTPDAEYRIHHDHGGFYGKDTELRPFTILAFLNSLPDGGFTSFPKLQTKITPRLGDAIVWSNELPNGSADPDMMHAGEPPGKEGIEKYALNVWIMRDKEAADYSSAWRADMQQEL